MRSTNFWFKTLMTVAPILAVCIMPFTGCTDPKDASGYEQPVAQPPANEDEEAARALKNAIRESQGLPPIGAESSEAEDAEEQ